MRKEYHRVHTGWIALILVYNFFIEMRHAYDMVKYRIDMPV